MVDPQRALVASLFLASVSFSGCSESSQPPSGDGAVEGDSSGGEDVAVADRGAPLDGVATDAPATDAPVADAPVVDARPFAPFADTSTVALWLFDERQYPYTTLTDASENDYDLRLMNAGKLLAGKFGNALRLTTASDYKVSYSEWQGAMLNEFMKAPDGKPSGLWGPTGEPRKILDTLAGKSWTLELWLKLGKVPKKDAQILDLGDAFLPGVALVLDGGGAGFTLRNSYTGKEASCQTDASRLADLKWHHLAFSCSSGAIAHFLDGKPQAKPAVKSIAVQALPADSQPKDLAHETRGFTADSPNAWRRQHRFNIMLGEDRKGDADLDGWLDEMRLSDVVRYPASFSPPGTLSRNHGPDAPRPATPTGPPLIFAKTPLAAPVPIGSRKHLFIDDVLLETKSNVTLTVNPVTARDDLTLTTSSGKQPFRPPAGMWRETVVDHGGKIHLFIPDGYSSSEGITRLYVSKDGLDFTAPDLGVIDYKGSTQNNFVFHRRPMGATIFKDTNPAISPEELFKAAAWASDRGVYLYVSPDGIHWRRNETLALPVASGGDAETFWDDQRGLYVTHLKRDSGSNTLLHPGYGRRGVLFSTKEPFKGWPMKFLKQPYFEGWPFPMLTGEGLITFPVEPIVPFIMYHDIYRTRAIKYAWAPDTYLAFYWAGYHNQINDKDADNKRRRVRLAVSRDGEHWKPYTSVWYIPSVGTIDGKPVRDSMSFFGLIRRNNEIWHYAEFSTENNGDGTLQYSRLRQRLDGFVSIDAGAKKGTATTFPLIFTGKHLVLNVKTKAAGTIRVALLDAKSTPIKGFTLADSKPFTGDAIQHTVSWTGGSDVSSLAGKAVRVRLELQQAKVYSLQFAP